MSGPKHNIIFIDKALANRLFSSPWIIPTPPSKLILVSTKRTFVLIISPPKLINKSQMAKIYQSQI